MRITRRTALKGIAAAGVVATTGCGGGGTPDTKTITYKETSEFYKKLASLVNGGTTVTVDFDSQRISQDSEILKLIKNASNYEHVVSTLEKKNDDQGRKELRLMFVNDLAKPRRVTDGERAQSNGVLDPFTLTLGVVIVLAIAGTAAYAISKKYNVSITVLGGISGTIQFTPV